IIILSVSLYQEVLLLIKKQKHIKKYLVFLLIIFLGGFLIRFVNINNSQCPLYDNFEQSANGAIIASQGVYKYIDPPGHAVLATLITMLFGVTASASSIANVVFGSLTILVMFFVVAIHFQNAKTGLMAAFLVAFLKIPYLSSINGNTAVGTSVFFMLLSILVFQVYLITEKKNYLILLGLVVGFACQIYRLEISLLLIFFLSWFFEGKNLWKTVKKMFYITITVMIILLPFFIYENTFLLQNTKISLLERYMGQSMQRVVLPTSLNEKKQYDSMIVNMHGSENPYVGELGLLFLGKSDYLYSDFDSCHFNYWFEYSKEKNLFHKFEIVNILISVFFVMATFYYVHKTKKTFFIIVFCINIIIILIHELTNDLFLAYPLILGIIPLSSLVLNKFYQRKKMFIIIMLIIIIHHTLFSAVIPSFETSFLNKNYSNDKFVTTIYFYCYETSLNSNWTIYGPLCKPFERLLNNKEDINFKKIIFSLEKEDFIN
ncbi:MAG: glycosyltransferase family 39 protein, partial [Nanoarchaeota archaeon]|nr:glycosyltransferase family 39 protein [Nanoarchaeota archaeon]